MASSDETIKKIWGIDDPNVAADINMMASVISTKHGMFASIPIMCKGPACPYITVCDFPVRQRYACQRCPKEVATIMARFENYCKHFDIDPNVETIANNETIDVSLIRDLVACEIQMVRAENHIAINGDILGDTIVEVDKLCKEHLEKTITPEVEFLTKLNAERYKILDLLNSTRKNKSKMKQDNDDTITQTSKTVLAMAQGMKLQVGLDKLDKMYDTVENIDSAVTSIKEKSDELSF